MEDSLPKLTEAQVKKLRLLTIITLATKHKILPYSLLFNELDISEVAQVEDLIIEVVQGGLGKGKLDHRNQEVEFVSVIARDVPLSMVPYIKSVLTEWCTVCEEMLRTIKKEAERGNEMHAAAIEAELNVKEKLQDVKRKPKPKSSKVSTL